MEQNATKSDVSKIEFLIFIQALIIIGLLLLIGNKILKDINASSKLKLIEERAYQQFNPETEILLQYVVFDSLEKTN